MNYSILSQLIKGIFIYGMVYFYGMAFSTYFTKFLLLLLISCLNKYFLYNSKT